MNISLLGYYGKNNIGDDLFVEHLTRYLSKQAVVREINVFCDQKYYVSNSEKVKFILTNKKSILKRLWTLMKSNYVVWGGGTVSLTGKPSSLLKMQQIARLSKSSFGFLGIGLEQISSQLNPDALKLFRKADFLYLRDAFSYEFAKTKLKSPDKCVLGGDLAFLDLSVYQKYIKSQPSQSIGNLSFSGKFWWGDSRAEYYAKFFLEMIEKFEAKIHFLPGHVGIDRNDNLFHHRLKSYLPDGSYEIHEWQRPEEFLSVLSQMDFHIGNRLHSLIVADILGVANMGIGKPNSKIDQYLRKTNTLASLRLVGLMQPLPTSLMESIVQQYRRPDEFIQNESTTAQACLEQIFFR